VHVDATLSIAGLISPRGLHEVGLAYPLACFDDRKTIDSTLSNTIGASSAEPSITRTEPDFDRQRSTLGIDRPAGINRTNRTNPKGVQVIPHRHRIVSNRRGFVRSLWAA